MTKGKLVYLRQIFILYLAIRIRGIDAKKLLLYYANINALSISFNSILTNFLIRLNKKIKL